MGSFWLIYKSYYRALIKPFIGFFSIGYESIRYGMALSYCGFNNEKQYLHSFKSKNTSFI